jgi:hypothetical protein
MPREITLSQGKVAVVDDADFDWLNQWKWFALKSAQSDHWCAARNTSRKSSKKRVLYMHRLIAGLEFGDGREVDHINLDSLDNCRSNLRVTDRTGNMRNRRRRRTNRSGFKGVSFFKRDGNWKSRIVVDGKEIWLGYFSTPEAAHAAYCEAAKQYHGEFARTE